MVRLDSQGNNLPVVFCHHFFDQLLQAVTDWPDQNFPASLRTPNDMVDKEMNRVRFMDIFLFQVDSI